MKEKFVKKTTLSKRLISSELKSVHEALRLKIKDHYHNGLNSMLRTALYDLMPETKDAKKCLPSINIKLGQEVEVSVPT